MPDVLLALVGQPNSGKTTLFNFLSGSSVKTVNYPGATVDSSIGNLDSKFGWEARVIDTPGITSIAASSLDEKVTLDVLKGEKGPGKVSQAIVVVDATQLTRHLYLLKRVQSLGIPTVVAVTMSDLLSRKGLELKASKLEEMLGIPVGVVDGRTGEGIENLVKKLRLNQASLKLQNLKSDQEPWTSQDIVRTYQWSEEVSEKCIPSQKSKRDAPDPLSGKIDGILLHPFLGLLFFIFSMALIFSAIFWLAQPAMDLIEALFSAVQAFFVAKIDPSWGRDLFVEGVIGGISGVVVFLPQIVILFFALGFLEDSGYLARGAMLMDRPLSWIGLNGKSFVPILSGFACAIPAMMASRTISNRKERFLTIFVIPLMTCSARLPVYALLLAFIIPQDKPWLGGLALTGLYLMGIVLGAAVSTLASKFLKADERSSFILELPAYRRPKLRVVVLTTYQRAKAFLEKAGVTIVVVSLVLWILTHIPYHEGASPTDQLNSSVAGIFGQKFLNPLMLPMGFDWRIGVALICGFAAREVLVGALAIVLSVVGSASTEGVDPNLIEAMRGAKNLVTGGPLFTLASVAGLLFFIAFALQCLSTVMVSKAETRGWKIPMFQVLFFTGFSYLGAVVIYQILIKFT